MHTDIPTRAQVERLLAVRSPTCVSIYLPTSPLTQDAQASRIELKNLAGQALNQLRDAGVGSREVEAISESLDDLIEDDEFWEEQAWSLAVFSTAESTRTFRLPNLLTAEAEVGDRFYVKPLLRAVTFPQAAFVLALAAGSVRLVEATREGPAFTVPVPGLPSDAASASRKASLSDRAPVRRVQGSEGQKLRLRQYSRKIDSALRPVLGSSELPLILATTEPLDAIFRSVSSYPHLASQSLHGNPEDRSDEELASAARSVLDELYEQEVGRLRELFDQRFQEGRASSDTATIARAATFGAVDTLLVDIDQKLDGRIDAAGQVDLGEDSAGSYGIVDEIARRVLTADGRVLALRSPEVPGEQGVAAILRYAI